MHKLISVLVAVVAGFGGAKAGDDTSTPPTLPPHIVDAADQMADVDAIVDDICQQVRYAIEDGLDREAVLNLRLGEYIRTHPADDAFGLTYFHGVVVGCFQAMTSS